jgi:hypothetical protein
MLKQVGRHNPYKAALYTVSPKHSSYDAAMEEAKIKTPKLYQRIKREEALAEAERPFIAAMLDDPAIIAMLDEALDWLNKNEQNKLSAELSLLGVEAGASKREIRNAYRRKARKLHPDVGGDAESFKQLHAAYRALLKVAHE